MLIFQPLQGITNFYTISGLFQQLHRSNAIVEVEKIKYIVLFLFSECIQ